MGGTLSQGDKMWNPFDPDEPQDAPRTRFVPWIYPIGWLLVGALVLWLLLSGSATTQTLTIGGAIRPDASGEWAVIADAGHAPRGIERVESDGATVTVYFSGEGSVVTFIAVADESMVRAGYAVGASVGTDRATLSIEPAPEYPLSPSANIWLYGLLEP